MRRLFRICLSVTLILLLYGLSYAPIVAADALPLEAAMISLDHQLFPFIYLSVAVNRYGEGISTLTKSNIQVTENGVPQTDYFDVTPPAAGGGVRVVDIVFLMDNSGSMSTEQSAVREHVVAFVDDLAAQGVDFQLGLCRFGAHENGGYPIIEDNGSLTSDAEYFKNQVWTRNVVHGGFEPGWDALYEASTAFSFRPGSQKVFILITDETPTDEGNVGNYLQTEAIDTLQAHFITTFALIELSGQHPHAVDDYGAIAEQTHGAYYDVLEALDNILNYISNLIPNSYRIAYKSSNPSFDGTERHVVVTVSYQGDQATCDGTYTPGSAPRIQRTQDTLTLHDQSWAAGTEFTIEAEITDDVEPYVQSATLYYQTTGDATYASTSMTHSSDIWSGTIPGSAVKSPGVDYYISATDGESSTTSPPVDPRTRPHQLAILPNVAPQITHTPVTTAMANTPVTITAKVVDTTNALDSIELWYRKVGQLIFKTNGQMANIGGDTYQDTIPSSYVTEAGVEYCILAYDDLGVGNRHGSFFDPHVITVSGNRAPETTIKTHVIDSVNGTAKFTWSGSDDSTPPAQLVYEHRLLKPDSPLYGWSDWSSNTTATFTGLPSGTYRFQVKAKDADEAIQPSPTTYNFTIGAGAPGTISGRVTDASTSNGIAGGVLLLDPDPLTYCPITDADGQFLFSVPPGTYSITASKDGYVSHTKVDITVVTGQTITANFALTPTDDDNTLYPGSRVRTTVFGLRVREEPHLNAEVRDTMYKGNSGVIKSGPVTCSDGLVWWEIDYDIDALGWSAQATVAGTTCLEPLPNIPSLPQGFAGWAEIAITWAQARTEEYGEAKHWYDSDNKIGYCAKFVANAFMNTDATGWDCPNAKPAGGNADDLFQELDRWNQESGDWENAPIGSLIFFGGTETNSYGHVAIYIAHDRIIHAHGRVREQSLTDLLEKAGTAGYKGIGQYIGWAYPPERWRPTQEPTRSCNIELRKKDSVTSIDTIAVNSSFDIYVGDSTGNPDKVRFSSDDDQDNLATGGWTKWFSWDKSSGDWNAATKCISWTSTTDGKKEVCAEIKDDTGSIKCFANISVVPLWRQFIQLGDILYDPCTFQEIGHVGIYIGDGETADPQRDKCRHSITTWDFPNRKNVQILRVECPGGYPGCAADAAEWAKSVSAPDRDYSYQTPIFSFKAEKNPDENETEWYCSELVWAAYFNYGIDIEAFPGNISTNYYNANVPVSPNEICEDGDVYPVSGHTNGVTQVILKGQCDCSEHGSIRATCPVDLVITDPDGLTISKENNEILEAVYWMDDFDGDGSLDVLVEFKLKKGNYEVQIEPRPEAEPTDTYTLVFENHSTGQEVTLADEALVKDIPDEPYQVEVSDGLSEPTSSSVILGPNPVTNTGTVFFYTLPEGTSTAKLMIFNVTGRPLFETPLDVDSTRFPSAGTWNPVDQDGASLANGPYVYVLIADGKVIGQGKMVIQR